MTQGLPKPPRLGATALPVGTFDDTVVAVTGGGTGLGRAIAVEFARLGAQIGILSRDAENRAAGVEAVEAAGSKAFATECDVRDERAIGVAFNTIEAALGPIGVLVNNAGMNMPVPAEDISFEDWRAVTQTILDGTFLCSREFARRRIDLAEPGTVLNLGASYSWTGGPGFAHAAAAKAGVKSLTETLAVEWAPYGIRVNCIVPGLITGVAADGKRTPALRPGDEREVGWAATFLASPFASYITGSTLTVDGGGWQRRAWLQPKFTPVRDQLKR